MVKDLIRDKIGEIILILVFIFIVIIAYAVLNGIPTSEPVVNQTVEKGKESINILVDGFWLALGAGGIVGAIALIKYLRS